MASASCHAGSIPAGGILLQGAPAWIAVHEPFPLSRPEGSQRTIVVRHVSVVPPEIKLIAVPLQMPLADAVKRSVQTALQEREESFDGLGVYCAV